MKTVNYNGTLINVSRKDHYYHRWPESPKEPYTYKIFDKFTDDKTVCLDIGACRGVTTLYLAKRCKVVYAIEPDPVALEDISANIAVNDITNVILIDKCLSDVSGPKLFGGNGPLGNSESSVFVNTGTKSLVTVDGITIDQLLVMHPGILECSFIKIDIEGSEKIVIPAMKNYLSEHRPTVYISFHTRYGIITKEEERETAGVLKSIYPHVYDIDLNRSDGNYIGECMVFCA